jgi:glutamyl-tRNA synthetase
LSQILRFAPSPSGFLHVGGARTAIFNWLLARKCGGKFLLRIEDTNRQRSTEESIKQIFSGLKWLGIDWDDEVLYQSKRRQRHIEAARQLLDSGHAYRCFCTKEELDEKRKIAQQNKIDNRYDRACRNLPQEAINEKLAKNHQFSVRFKTPQGEIFFNDIIHGETRINNETLDDFIILRSDGTPIYQLAVVVDDHDMGVTKILRGDDHLSNTSKQILIYQALNWQVPQFGHLPLILGADKVRLSKRHGAASVEEFRDQGILPQALFNYLCLLGWSTGDDKEIMDRNEIIQKFDEKRINNCPAIFDIKKLLWFNSKHIGLIPLDKVMPQVMTWLDQNSYKLNADESDRFQLFVKLQKDRASTLIELNESLHIYFKDPDNYEDKGVKKFFLKDSGEQLLLGLFEALSKEDSALFVDIAKLDDYIRSFAEKNSVAAAKIIHPLRLALTGRTASPGIFELIHTLGKEKVLRRLEKSLNYIKQTKN